MKGRLNLILAALAVAGLSGCATMSGDECLTSDWNAIGYEDGVRGYTADRIGKHRKACAKHGVTPDLASYQNGRDQGLAEYCQPSRGFNVGANGGSYNGVCSAHYEVDFVEAFNAGRHLYVLRSNVNHANSAINAREHELDDIDVLVREKEVLLIGRDTPTEERVLLLADLKDLSERRGELEAEIRDLYDERAHSEVELEQYQIQVSDLGY